MENSIHWVTARNSFFFAIIMIVSSIAISVFAQWLYQDVLTSVLFGIATLILILNIDIALFKKGREKTERFAGSVPRFLNMNYKEVGECIGHFNKIDFRTETIDGSKNEYILRRWETVEKNMRLHLLFDKNDTCVRYKVEWMACRTGLLMLFLLLYFLMYLGGTYLLVVIKGAHIAIGILLFLFGLVTTILSLKELKNGPQPTTENKMERFLWMHYNDIIAELGKTKRIGKFVYYDNNQPEKGFFLEWKSPNLPETGSIQTLKLFFNKEHICIKFIVIEAD